MCGCKLSTSAPFCDGSTCKKIIAGESFENAERLFKENEEADAAVPELEHVEPKETQESQ
jgi:CDGSH-type Zn-finger protein